MLNLEFAQLSDPGKSRDHNEDFIGYAEPGTPEQARSHGWLFALADGLGGHDRGEGASQLAGDTLVSSFYASPSGEAPRVSRRRPAQPANLKLFPHPATLRPAAA